MAKIARFKTPRRPSNLRGFVTFVISTACAAWAIRSIMTF